VTSNADFSKMRPIAENISDFWISGDKLQLAAIELLGSEKSRLVRYDLTNLSVVETGPEFDQISFASFPDNGNDFFYFGKRGKTFYGFFNGQEEQLPEGYEPVQIAMNQSDKSVTVLVKSRSKVFLYRMFRTSGRQSRYEFIDAEWLVHSADGTQVAFIAKVDSKQHVVVNDKYGPVFDRVVAPMFSPDGKYLVYRARKGDKRFVVVADRFGKTVRQHPAYDHVHDVKFVRNGKAVAYGVKAGRTLAWKVEPL
jgi:hypothetical protein